MPEYGAREHGFDADGIRSPHPITKEDLVAPISRVWRGSPESAGDSSSGPNAAPASPAMSGVGWHSEGDAPGGGTSSVGGSHGPPAALGRGWRTNGGPQLGPPALPSPGPGGSLPGGTTPITPVAPGTPAMPGGSPLSAVAQGGVSPGQLGQTFMSGLTTGQPAGASAQALTGGAIEATPPPQAPPSLTPPVAPSIPMANGESFATASSSMDIASMTGGPPASSTGGSVPVAPAVMTGGSWSAPAAPVGSGSSVSVGPLPAYGSDLRPPVTAPPAMPSIPASASGAPVAPSASSSPSAGGPLVSPVERAASGATGGPTGANSSTMAGASAVSATAGATAGAVSTKAVRAATTTAPRRGGRPAGATSLVGDRAARRRHHSAGHRPCRWMDSIPRQAALLRDRP